MESRKAGDRRGLETKWGLGGQKHYLIRPSSRQHCDEPNAKQLAALESRRELPSNGQQLDINHAQPTAPHPDLNTRTTETESIPTLQKQHNLHQPPHNRPRWYLPSSLPNPPPPKLTSPPPPQALRIIPADSHSSTFTHIPDHSFSAPSAPGLHDTLRAGVGPSPYDAVAGSTTPVSAHPLEARLKAWDATRDKLRMTMLQRVHGIAAPLRHGMELDITRRGEARPLALRKGGRAGVHEEILTGRDEMITWEDVYTGETTRAAVSFHDEMERKLKI